MPTVWDPLHSNPILCWYSHHLDMCEIWPQSFCHQLVQSPVSHHHDCRCPGIKWSPGHLQFWCRPILNKYCCRCYLLYDLYWKFTFFFFLFFYTRCRFWSSGIVVACVYVRPPECQPFACPHDNLWPIQARITKFGPEVQNTLVKICIVLGGWLTLTFKL